MSKGNTNHFKYEKELIRNKYTTETNQHTFKQMEDKKGKNHLYEIISKKKISICEIQEETQKKITSNIQKIKLFRNDDFEHSKCDKANDESSPSFGLHQSQNNEVQMNLKNYIDIANNIKVNFNNNNEVNQPNTKRNSGIIFEADGTFVTFGNESKGNKSDL